MHPNQLVESQQISLFEQPFSFQGAAVAPLFVETPNLLPVKPAVDLGVFSEISLSGSAQQCLQLIAPILRD